MAFSSLGYSKVRLDLDHGSKTEYIQIQSVLKKVLAFTGRTIDDVVNDPIARKQVFGYFKLHKWIARQGEVGDLERQWNSVPLR